MIVVIVMDIIFVIVESIISKFGVEFQQVYRIVLIVIKKLVE